MKTRILRHILLVAALWAVSVAPALAQDDKEKTFKGKGQCAKCELKKTEKCQNSIKLKENGKEVVYLLDHNEVSRKFHKHICVSVKEIIVTGRIKEEKGNKIIVPKTIKLAKEE